MQLKRYTKKIALVIIAIAGVTTTFIQPYLYN